MNASRFVLRVLLVAWLAAPAGAAENWIADGDFEARESFAWQRGTWQDTVAHAGRGALRLDAGPGATEASARHAPIEVGQSEPQEVMASCWLRLEAKRQTGPLRGGLTLRVEMADGKALAWYGPFAIDPCQSGSWVYREHRWVPPAPIVRIRPTVYLSGCEGSLYVDEIYLGPPRAAARPPCAAIPLAATGMGGQFKEFARFSFESFRPAAHVFELRGGNESNLKFLARIDVSQPAPIWLSSAGGSQYWTLVSPQRHRMAHFYTKERLDLSATGPREVSLPFGGLSSTTDPLVPGGWVLVTACTKSFYINPAERIAAEVRRQTGKSYWDVARVENLNASLAPGGATAAFSLADLSSYKFRASARRQGSGIRVRPVLVDAQGGEVPLYGIDLAAMSGVKTLPLAAETAAEGFPTGDYRLAAPVGAGPLRLSGKVRLAIGQKMRDVPFSLEVPVGEAAPGRRAAARLELAGWDSPSYTLSATNNYGPESMRRLVADAKRLGLAKLVILARTGTETCYRSRLAAPESLQEFDAVAAAATEGRRQGVEIHAGYILGVAQPCDLKRHPDWAAVDRRGKPNGWYCYNRAAVRKFHAGLMAEIVAGYPVAGVSLDYCRPGGGCFCGRCAAAFQARYGKRLQEVEDRDADWGKFQRESITEYLRQLRAAIAAARPGAGLGGYVWGRFGPDKDRAGQDWPQWLHEGIFDFVAVGIYTPSSLQFRAQCETLAELVRRDPAHCQGRIYPLLGAGYIGHAFRGHDPAGEVMGRHLTAAAEAGLSGAGFFTTAEVRTFPEVLARHSR